RDGQHGGLSGLAARLDAAVQGAVGASPIAGLVRGLHQRPAKLRRAVLGEVAAPRRLAPGVDDRVEARGPHPPGGAAEALGFAELGEDVAGEDRADAVDRLERLAAAVGACEAAQLALELALLVLEQVDQAQQRLDLRPRDRGERERADPAPALAG